MTEQQPSLDGSGPPLDVWRNEVQARLERYKRRRGRRIEGAFTMRFPFPTEEPPAVEASPDVELQLGEQLEPVATGDQLVELTVAEKQDKFPDTSSPPADKTPLSDETIQVELAEAPSSGASVAAPEPESEEAAVPVIDVPPRPQPRRKVIAFPAPTYVPAEATRRLADPVQPEQLRILDVPEELQAIPATPFLEGLLDAPASSGAPGLRGDGVELPCAPARGVRRAGAALLDLMISLGGLGVCAAAASRFLGVLAPTKFVVAGVAAISVMLWASYQYLFLVYGGRTLGMRATRVRLQTFKGRSANFRQRQLRAFGLYLSVLSLGMGVLWCLVDVDSLCWHDRISQTFPAAADKS